MARSERPSRRARWRRRRRERVPAWPVAEDPRFDPRWGDGDDLDDGSAGVREPRRPKPVLPTAAAALPEPEPEPEPPQLISLPDPRY